jgi:orotidine 5'-phosphate decarboxylase subfamily 1
MPTKLNPLSYGQRAETCLNSTARRLFQIMEEKTTNLAVAVDVSTKQELISFAKSLGSSICILKTHIDIINDYDPQLILELQKIADDLNFLLFEDRKFADIGNTVKQQYRDGIYKIASWAHITNAHILPGPGIIEGLKEVGHPLGRGLLLLAEMSSEKSLATGSYTLQALEMAKQYPEFVIGFIAQRKLIDLPNFLHLTPGVNLSDKADPLGQQYNSPAHIIGNQGSDIIIVGRGITHSVNPHKEAERYRAAGWQAYLKRSGF